MYHLFVRSRAKSVPLQKITKDMLGIIYWIGVVVAAISCLILLFRSERFTVKRVALCVLLSLLSWVGIILLVISWIYGSSHREEDRNA